jgi:hypothetical protein
MTSAVGFGGPPFGSRPLQKSAPVERSAASTAGSTPASSATFDIDALTEKNTAARMT